MTPAGVYRIRSGHSALVASAAEDGQVVQAAVTEAESQYWWLVPTVQGSTKIIHVASSLLLGLEGGSADDGAAIVLDEDANAEHQRWSVDVLTDGSLRFVPRSSGKALGVANASTSADAPLEQRRWLLGGSTPAINNGRSSP